MFGLWRKVAEKGSVAIPVREEALSNLEWAEVADVYPDLVPSRLLGYDVYCDRQLIWECPFVRIGDACKFKVEGHGNEDGLEVFVNTRQLVHMLCGKDYHVDEEGSFLEGVLTCSCGIPDCDGIEDQVAHVSRRMVRWDVLRSRSRYEFFFEREAYDVGVVRLLHDLCQTDSGIDLRIGGGYESREVLIDEVRTLLMRHPYYADIWSECGFEPLEKIESQ